MLRIEIPWLPVMPVTVANGEFWQPAWVVKTDPGDHLWIQNRIHPNGRRQGRDAADRAKGSCHRPVAKFIQSETRKSMEVDGSGRVFQSFAPPNFMIWYVLHVSESLSVPRCAKHVRIHEEIIDVYCFYCCDPCFTATVQPYFRPLECTTHHEDIASRGIQLGVKHAFQY